MQHVKFIPVVSSNIEAIGYDEKLLCLYVRFQGGKVWRYFEVDEGRWNAFRLDKSKGKHFSKFIKPHFDGEEIKDEEPETDAHGLALENPTPRVVKEKKPDKKEETAKVSIRTGVIEL